MAGNSLPYRISIVDGGAPGEAEASESACQATPAASVPHAVPGAFVTLFKAHYAAVWRVLRRFGVPSAQLDDAAQEVFWIAARRLTDIRPGREHAFLYGVALRVASQEHRRRRRAPQFLDVDNLARVRDMQPSPEEQVEQRQARALLDLVLDQMSTDRRAVFVLCELEELEVRDAAEIQGIPIGTASSRLRRAREDFSAIAKRVRAALLEGRRR